MTSRNLRVVQNTSPAASPCCSRPAGSPQRTPRVLSLMPVNPGHSPGIPAAASRCPGDSRASALGPSRRPGRRRMQHRGFALIALCSAINSSECSLLFKHPVLPKPYLGGVFPQHMLEFTVSAAALQSTFGFSHPQTAVLIRGGFPSLSRGGQAQQFAF